MYQQQPLRSAGSALQRLPQQWLHSGCICRRFKQQQNSAHAAINCTLKLQHEHQAHGLQVSWRLQARQHWRATAAAAAGAATTSAALTSPAGNARQQLQQDMPEWCSMQVGVDSSCRLCSPGPSPSGMSCSGSTLPSGPGDSSPMHTSVIQFSGTHCCPLPAAGRLAVCWELLPPALVLAPACAAGMLPQLLCAACVAPHTAVIQAPGAAPIPDLLSTPHFLTHT
jgi:hypothetical protein